MAKQTRTSHKNQAGRLESILAYMAAGLVGTSVIVMVITLLVSLSTHNLPAILVFYPQFGLIAGGACIVALLIVSLLRRSRENKAE